MRFSPFAKFSAYFDRVAREHPEIKSFYEIDEEEIVSGLRSKVSYPVLLVECPDFSVFDNSGNTDALIPSGLAILSPCKPGDYAKRRELLASNEIIVLDIISRLREDNKNGVFYINSNDFVWRKISGWSNDSLCGWRLEFKLQDWINLEYNPEQWLNGEGGPQQ